jgi:hypothetical protein
MLLGDLAQMLPPAALAAFLPHIPPIFMQAMSAQSPHQVRVEAVKAACGMILQQANEDGGEKKVEGLTGITAPVLEVIAACVSAKDSQGARECLSSLMDVVDVYPGFFRTTIQAVLSASMSLCRE